MSFNCHYISLANICLWVEFIAASSHRKSTVHETMARQESLNHIQLFMGYLLACGWLNGAVVCKEHVGHKWRPRNDWLVKSYFIPFSLGFFSVFYFSSVLLGTLYILGLSVKFICSTVCYIFSLFSFIFIVSYFVSMPSLYSLSGYMNFIFHWITMKRVQDNWIVLFCGCMDFNCQNELRQTTLIKKKVLIKIILFYAPVK